jgi:hypothetical protein
LKTHRNAIQTVVAAVLLSFFGLGQQSAASPVAKTATKTVVVSSANPSVFGQLVTFTATVTPKSGSGTPTGIVNFQIEGTTVMFSYPFTIGGTATWTTSLLHVGTDVVKVSYLSGPGTNFLNSSGTVSQKVAAIKSSTTTVVTSTSSTSTYGQSVSFTATVSSSGGTPADGEKVTFKNGSATLGTGNLAGGVATFNTTFLTPGSHTITALYAGDTQFLASSGSTPQTVQKASTNLSISPFQGTVGQPVQITANVVSSTGAVPTGSVTFKNGTATLGHATLSGGNASITSTFSTVGPYTIQAAYAGGADFLANSHTSILYIISPTIAVSITNKTGNVQAGGSAVTLNATVQNDSHNAGVGWTLTANNATCSPACGTLSNTTSTSVTYAPPATEPTGANTNPTITATSVTDGTKSDTDSFSIASVAACGTGNEAILNGQYAFLLRGFKTSGVNESVGSFTADGTGKITAAEIDLNDLDHGPRQPVFVPNTSTYSVGPDNRGCLTFNTTDGSGTFRFVLGGISAGVATKGRMIQFTDTTGSGSRATGILLKQDPTSFSTGLSGNYAYGASGEDVSGARFMSIGAVTASAGSFSNGEGDVEDAGTTNHATGMSGSYASTLDSNGRGTGNLSQSGLSGDFAFYVVSSSEVFFVSTDVLGASTPIQAGEVRLQTGTFTDSSMNGPMVFHMDGLDGTSIIADIGILNANGTGSLTGTDYGDDGGTSKTESLSGTYAAAGNGRVTISLPGPGGFAYLNGPGTGFLLDSGGGEMGEFEPQAAGPFSNASLSGNFFHGTYAVDSQGSSTETGTATLDGAGNISGTGDNSGSNGLSTQTFTDTYAVNSDGSGNIGSGTVMMVISNNKLVFIDEGDGGTSTNPKVTVVEK